MSQATAPEAHLDDLRAALAAQASRAEQRNRPRAYLLVACIVLIIGAWFAWDGFRRSAEAASAAENAERYAQNVVKAAGHLKGLQSQGDIQVHAPMTSLYSRIESMGTPAGLKKSVPIPSSQTRPERGLGWNLVKTTYVIRDLQLSAILKWIDLVVADIPGMEVHTISVRPQPTEWEVTVVFSRWEKAEGGS
ncbi:MAG: hypothetical protein U0637_00190 [Phycisphaerales bacterium]